MNKKDKEQLELNYLEFLLQTAQTTDLSLPEKKMILRIIQTSDKLDLRIWEEIKSADIIISDQFYTLYKDTYQRSTLLYLFAPKMER